MDKHGLVMLGHGSGGTLTHDLLKNLVFPAFANPVLEQADDAALVGPKGTTAFTTDSFVVRPLFFPGGDIGKLSVCGTVNDLAMMGARPLYLTAACVIEEGLPLATLEKIIRSMAATARKSGVRIVGGDLKVVEKGAADGMFITTSGIGLVPAGLKISANNARPGDAVLINGPIGEHAAAVMISRQDYKLRCAVRSDCAALNGLVQAMLAASRKIRVLRDPTRGGVATTLNEICRQSKVAIEIDENRLVVPRNVRGVCELLGIDPLYMANEGKVLCCVAQADAAAVLRAMRRHPLGKQAAIIGRVSAGTPLLTMKTSIGSTRIVNMLTTEQLPRIC